MFSIKPTDSVIARRARAPDAAIFNESICHRVTNYGCAERNRTLKWRERTQNDAANLLFFVISIPFCFALPCFATGCHAFGFKIATAALRPRNDTKIGMFLFGKRTFFIFCDYFLRGVAPHLVFQTFRSGDCSVSHKTDQICHCEEGAFFAPDAAIFDGTICHSVTNYGCAERNRTLKRRKRKQNDATNPMFFVIGLPFCFVLPCFAMGCHAFGFKIATAALRPRNDTKIGTVLGQNSLPRRFLTH